MSIWLYQMNQDYFPPSRYRLDIWEGESCHWEYGKKHGDSDPKAGDRVIFYYTPSKGNDPGVYGWAIIISSFIEEKQIYFKPVAPSDILKMFPWFGDDVLYIIKKIRSANQGTLYQINEDIKEVILPGIIKWVNQINRNSV